MQKIVGVLLALMLNAGSLYGNKSKVEVWDKTFGGRGSDNARAITRSSDGGYLVAGATDSKGAGKSDIWLIKVDKSGNNLWDKTFGGRGLDSANTITRSSDGGYLVAGGTYSKGAGKSDIWLIKVDEDGNKVWDKTFGGHEYDFARAITRSSDGGYLVAGGTELKGTEPNAIWIIKIDKNGNKMWDKTFGGSKWGGASAITQSSDGGYIVAGSTDSKGAGESDVWLIKIDKSGNKVWDRTFGGSESDSAFAITRSSDGGYLVAGDTDSKGAGKTDIWLIKVDEDGNKVWDKTFGGHEYDFARAITRSSDGGYLVAGSTKLKGIGNAIWLIKIDKSGNKVWDRTFGGDLLDIASAITHSSDGGYLVVGGTYSKGAGNYDIWLIKVDEDGNTNNIKLEAESNSKFSLTITTSPANAKVQITNIKPRYTDGMKLKKGTYKIKVSKKGYESIRESIVLKKDSIYRVKLVKERRKMSGREYSNIGTKYYFGRGVTKNYTKAREYYSKACSMGDKSGCSDLGYLYHYGRGININYAKAKEYYSKACGMGDREACNGLGQLYYNGEGVNQDYAKARGYYNKACNMGYKKGCSNYQAIKNK